MSLGVLEVHADGVAAAVAESSVEDDCARADMVALAYERGDTRVNKVDGTWVVVVGVVAGGDQLNFTVGAHGRRVWKELTVIDQLPLSEAECSIE